jgi:hypothetical protein
MRRWASCSITCPGPAPRPGSRADPPLALARLRARGQLTELRDAELRFTADEAAAFLRETADADLPDAAVTALTARTEAGRRGCNWRRCRYAAARCRPVRGRVLAATASCSTT